jgi:hypothetical protein
MPINKGNLKFLLLAGEFPNSFACCDVADVALQNCGELAELRMECCKAAWLNPNLGWSVTKLLG